jgi:tripartite-type tricarboxylate transporter receptor subunit TctC
MIVPYGAGGTTDLTGRRFAAELRKQLGQAVTVVNQAGASGATGSKTVLDAAADGYTLLYCADSLGTQRVMGLSAMSYDDFIPIMTVVDDPKVIVAKKGAYGTLQDLVADMRARPGKVKMSYTGPGGSGHVQALVYNKFGLDMALTAYASGGDGILAILNGQVDFTNANYSTVTSYIESGDVVLLGVSATERLPTYPDVPTLAEVIPESRVFLETPFTPLSLMVNKATPADIVTTLRTAAAKAVTSPEWKAYVKENCLAELYLKYPDETAVKKFYKDWESYVSWLLYDAGAAKFSPEQFGIERSSK